MKRRSFLKGVAGLAVAPMVGVVAVRTVSNLGIVLGSKAVLAASYGSFVTVPYRTEIRAVVLNREWLSNSMREEQLGARAADTVNKLFDNIVSARR